MFEEMVEGDMVSGIERGTTAFHAFTHLDS